MTSPDYKAFFARFRSLLALGLMVLALSLLSDRFLTPDNGWNILRQISVNLCLSIGMTLVILGGGIDLSVGAILGLAGAVAAGLLKHGLGIPGTTLWIEFTVFGAILAAVFVGGAAGWCNGFAVTRFKLPPFVATLGMLSIARGLTMLWTGGFPITGLGDDFGHIGTGAFLGMPLPVWIMLALTALVAVKVVIAYAACRLFAGNHPLSLEAALLLAPAGEFAFVILTAARAADAIPEAPAVFA
jgi:ribose transport system permease protein